MLLVVVCRPQRPQDKSISTSIECFPASIRRVYFRRFGLGNWLRRTETLGEMVRQDGILYRR